MYTKKENGRNYGASARKFAFFLTVAVTPPGYSSFFFCICCIIICRIICGSNFCGVPVM